MLLCHCHKEKLLLHIVYQNKYIPTRLIDGEASTETKSECTSVENQQLPGLVSMLVRHLMPVT